MSTKTLRKRIALVAVASLGFGLVSVAPSFGAAATASAVAPNPSVAGVNSDLGTVTFGAIANNAADTYNVLVTGPANGALVITNLGGEIIPQQNPILAGATVTTIQGSATGPAAAATAISGYFTVPGSYTVTWGTGAGATASGTYNVALPATSALQASLITSSALGTVYKTAADDPIVAVTRPIGVGGTVKLFTLTSADSGNLPGTVLKTSGTPAQFTFASSPEGSATVFTFDSAAGAFDTAGSYSFRAWIDTNGDDLVTAGEPSADVSFRIAGAPATMAVSLSRSTIPNVDGNVIATITLVDALGAPTYSAGNVVYSEATAIAYMDADTNANANRIAGTNAYTKQINFTAGAATAGTANVVTFTDSVVATATKTATLTIADTEAATGSRLAMTPATGLYAGTAGAASFTTVIPAVTTNTATAVTSAKTLLSHTFTFTGTANKTYAVSLTTTGGRDITRYTFPATITTLADGTATFQVLNSAPVNSSTVPDTYTVSVSDRIVTTATYNNVTAGTAFTVGSSAGILVGATTNSAELTGTVASVPSATTITMSANTANQNRTAVAVTFTNTFSYTVTYRAAAAIWTMTPTASSNAEVLQKSTNTVTGVLRDNFGTILANAPYSVSVSGRNVTATSGTTSATGVATFTLVDAATTAYTLVTGFPTDTVTFSSVATTDLAAGTGAVTFTYAAALATVGTVTVTSPASIPVIDQVLADPSAPTTVTYTATVRGATGAAVAAGTLVTFAGGAGDIFLNGVTTGVTDANGQATVRVYRNLAGYQVITATANSVTGSSLANEWKNDGGDTLADGSVAQGAHDGRNITASAAQSAIGGSAATVVARVTDRWGNPVSGVLITWSTSGVGRPVTGADTTVGTDSNGQAQFQVTSLANESGALTVTAKISGGQTADIAGFVSARRVAGVTAGNDSATSTVTFTKDTSTSTADALLALAQALGTRDQASAAIDAAAEATDASNAATDAANAAAEAADAATAAAQDAADAVAALSTQVSEMVAALKKQITSLTNLVIKIQRKVRA
jgi:trimeric autotransporter adhesin